MTKIKISVQKKDLILVSAVLIFLIGVGFVVAYNSGASPNVMGHSFEELEGVQARITGTCGVGNAIRVVNTDGSVTCQSASGGSTLPTCSSGQVLKYSSGAWNCGTDIDTDTRCDVAGRCTQVCIGTDCRTSWTTSQCEWRDHSYNPGDICNPLPSCSWVSSNPIMTCGSDGSWYSGTGSHPCPPSC